MSSSTDPAVIQQPTEPSSLYAKLLGETAIIEWPVLEPFFARGALLWVAPGQDLIKVAEALAQDHGTQVARWLETGALEKLASERALDLQQRQPVLWAVVVSPWVLVQERAPA